MKVSPTKPPLKICLLIGSDISARWVTDTLDRVADQRIAKISQIYLCKPKTPDTRWLIPRIMDSIAVRFLYYFENRLYGQKSHALDTSSLKDYAESKGITASFLQSTADLKSAVAFTKDTEYDVILHFGRYGNIPNDLFHCNPLIIRIPFSGHGAGMPPGLPEVGSGSGIIQSEIVVSQGDEGKILCHPVISAVNPTAYFQTVHNHYRRLSHYISDLLNKIRQSHRSAIDNCHFSAFHVRETTKNRWYETSTLYVCRYYLRKIRKWFLKLLFYEQWVLLFAEETWDQVLENPSVLKMIRPPGKTGWADPFILEHKEGRFLLYEEIPEGQRKGHLSIAVLGPHGALRNGRVILENEYHLSFPHIFRYQDEWFMVPESSAGRTIDLYRCTSFPDNWTFSRTLFSGIEAHDSSLIHYQGKWWLFTTVKTGDNKWNYDDLYIYHADDLLSGQWVSHPLNPVISDPRSGRNAGKLFIHNGKPFRVAQNCSHYYGYGIEVFGIDILDEHHYEEHHISSLKPFKMRIAGIHTINHGDHCTVLDARIWQFRLRFPFKQIRL